MIITAFPSVLPFILAQAAPPAAGGSSLTPLLVQFGLIIAIIYFIMIRPQQRQRKQHEDALRALKKGDEIVTAGGIVGEVIHIREMAKEGTAKPLDDRITIKSAESRLIVERGRIARILPFGHDGRLQGTGEIFGRSSDARGVTLLDIRVLGDPILRAETRVVDRVTDEIRQLARDMFETMYAAKGIGLAAPQVGRTERLAVVDVGDRPLVIINPEILSADGSAKAEEGCLSIPDIYGDVERPAIVRVRALDLEFKPFEVDGDELFGRCLQHEIDHLHGKLFIDYLSVLKRRAALAKWAKEKDKYPGSTRRLTPAEVAGHHHRDEEL